MDNSANSDEEILCISAAPHTWLFPRMAGVIHHGGAGTTAAVLASGLTMTICPFTGDQPFWARRMYELGVSTQPLEKKSMSTDSFANRITALTQDSKLKRNAAALSIKIREEQGVERTADFIEKRLS